MRLLIFVDWYLPGYKAGGQISSCANTVFALQDKLEIFIITRDRDLDDIAAYTEITANTWQSLGKAKIIYLSPGRDNFSFFRKLIREISPDTIYFNSMFSYRFTLLPLVVIKNIRYAGKVILAPRGMLQAGAIQFKPSKKKLVLRTLYYTGLLNKVLFHATDETEEKDIKKNISGHPRIQMVYDFPAVKQDPLITIDKQPGHLKCIFVSRISPKKNLLYLLEVMSKSSKNISLTVAGPVEDKSYWDQCLRQIEGLPGNCKVTYIGSVPKNELPDLYRRHHLFILPTFGENFGHVIFDSFINGRPVLISDQTPWKQLQLKGIGKDISLDKSDELFKALEYFADLDKEVFEKFCLNAWLFGKMHIERAAALTTQYESLFS